jgi:hypothetical protein
MAAYLPGLFPVAAGGRAVAQGAWTACCGGMTGARRAAWPQRSAAAAGFHSTAPCEARLRLRGTVVSDKAQKSVVVAVERIFKHPVVDKYVKARSKFMAHDELDQFKVQAPRAMPLAWACAGDAPGIDRNLHSSPSVTLRL